MKQFARIFIIILFVLAGCQRQSNDPVTTTPPIAAAATATTPALTVLATAPIAVTETAVFPDQPSATPSPTSTNAPTVTPTITPTPSATPIPVNPVTSITLNPVTNYTFLKPTSLTHAGDDRLFVTEQQGVIRIIQNGQVLPEPFLYIVDRVGSTELEQGLLSVAFHPHYQENGTFFVDYTRQDGSTVISRFQVSADNPNIAAHNSEQILLTISQPYANHNGGQLQFGPDGYLYVGMGDGGSANDPLGSGQNLDTLLGKLLRLDVDFNPDGYAIPATNPFINNADARNEIWAYGLRNPWRFSFDRLTGDLLIADVGQNLWEEIDWQSADSPGGENYGWNTMEAKHCFQPVANCNQDGLQRPIFEYSHELGCSISGGYIYRGSDLALYGNYFFGDYCQGTIWSLTPNGDGSWQSHVVYRGAGNISSFGEDVNGELYVVNHLGSVSQIRP